MVAHTHNGLQLSGTGAAYIRVSKEIQDEARQRESIDRWLARHQLSIKPEHVYVDLDWKRREAAIRPAFNQMLALVDAGRIKWIVVDDSDRFGAEDKFALVSYLHRLRQAGCKLVTVGGKEPTSADIG